MTSSVLTRKIEEFEARLWNEAIGPTEAGKTVVDGTALIQIVLDDPELAELYVRHVVGNGVRSSFQLANVIATTLAANTGDHSLLRLIEAEGAVAAPVQIFTAEDDAAPDLEEPAPATALEPRAVQVLTIPEDELAACDVQRASLFSTQPEHLLAVRGSVIFDFPSTQADSRPDFIIPEVRRFVTELDRSVPHLAWFLVALPEFEQMRIYFLCLTPESRLVQQRTRSPWVPRAGASDCTRRRSSRSSARGRTACAPAIRPARRSR